MADAEKPEVLTEPASLEDLDRAVMRVARAKEASERTREAKARADKAHKDSLEEERAAFAERAAVLRRLGPSYRVTDLVKRSGMKQQQVSTILNDADAT